MLDKIAGHELAHFNQLASTVAVARAADPDQAGAEASTDHPHA